MADEGWVRMYHPDQYDEIPDPDEPDDAHKFSTVTREAFDQVWTKRGWVDLDKAREQQLKPRTAGTPSTPSGDETAPAEEDSEE